jgi:hypothetical protein
MSAFYDFRTVLFLNHQSIGCYFVFRSRWTAFGKRRFRSTSVVCLPIFFSALFTYQFERVILQSLSCAQCKGSQVWCFSMWTSFVNWILLCWFTSSTADHNIYLIVPPQPCIFEVGFIFKLIDFEFFKTPTAMFIFWRCVS